MENYNLQDKRVLVTGADGFIGSHLVEWLLKEGARVRAFVFYNSFNSWGWLDELPKEILGQVEVVAGDIRDPHGVRTAIRECDAVFHLASLIAIPFSYHSPDAYVDTNIKGALNVLQACREFGVGKVIITSTSEVYGTAKYVPIDEQHPFQGQSPYSASKIGADRIAESFYRSFGVPVVIARPFNTYGPRQSARAVIPTVITQILGGEKTIKLGALHPTRDFNYIDDTCRGFIALAKCNEAIGREINIGSGTEISISNLAALILKLMCSTVEIVSEDLRSRPERSEVERLVCNNRLINQLTGWSPAVPLGSGLEKTIDWFRDASNLKRYKYGIYNL